MMSLVASGFLPPCQFTGLIQPWNPDSFRLADDPGRAIRNDTIHPGMAVKSPNSHYALVSTDAEHERLIRQAAWLAAPTERLFREAGIGPGRCVLDIGSGIGDVALIAAMLGGPSGAVVRIERDSRSIARANARVAEAGLGNVTFTQTDAAQIPTDPTCTLTVFGAHPIQHEGSRPM